MSANLWAMFKLESPISDHGVLDLAPLLKAREHLSRLLIPIDQVKVSAGFPSPAADYEDGQLDINEYLIRNPVSTFFFPVQGDSMEGAHIFDGDVLVVDRSIRASHGSIVIAFVNGERLVKRLHLERDRVALIAENPQYPPLEIAEGIELIVWGVVIGKFRRLPL